MAPREGHIQALQHLFGCLKAHNDGKILTDIGKAPIREEATISDGFSWSEFYQDTSEDVPLEMQQDGHLWSGCLSGAWREDRFIEEFAEVGFHGIESAAFAAAAAQHRGWLGTAAEPARE